MAEPFTGEIKMFALNFAPRDWALCDGQIMTIAQNTELYTLLGTAYGGNGTTNFGIPDMRGRVPIQRGDDYMGSYYQRGWSGGQETVTLASSQIPPHTHSMMGSTSPGSFNHVGQNKDRVLAAEASIPTYTVPQSASDLTSLASGTSTVTGGNQAHNNMQPSIVINFVIALRGTYPSRN